MVQSNWIPIWLDVQNYEILFGSFLHWLSTYLLPSQSCFKYYFNNIEKSCEIAAFKAYYFFFHSNVEYLLTCLESRRVVASSNRTSRSSFFLVLSSQLDWQKFIKYLQRKSFLTVFVHKNKLWFSLLIVMAKGKLGIFSFVSEHTYIERLRVNEMEMLRLLEL